jgi:hypothetical protein
MKLTGKDGVLRIFDSSQILHGAGIYAGVTIDVVKFDGVSTWANITSDVEADDVNIASDFLTDNNDKVYIGSTSKFALVRFLKGGGADYAVGSGVLLAKYFDGSDFASALEGVSDGGASGGDCFAQDGYIGFKIPADWATGANAFNANLDSDKYYIELGTTTSPSTDPDADILAPVEGQYFEVAFAAMDLSGPMGRAKTEELLVLDRMRAGSRMHYIAGADDLIYEPLPLTFACLLDDVYNQAALIAALTCGNPGSTYWDAAGVTAKGTTKNDGSNANPAFADATKKAVSVQILFAGDTTSQGWAYYETFFAEEQQQISESEDGVSLACNGGVFGVVERMHGFGIRY